MSTFRHEHSDIMALLNDEFRKRVLRQPHPGGICHLTRGFNALPDLTKDRVYEMIRAKNEWDPGNDPYAEHDFGSVEIVGVPKVFWKISYYKDHNMEYGTETPESLTTFRVLTVMLAEEY